MISMIVAMTRNRVIGKNNELPWHIPEDFRWFVEKTNGKPVIMGRRTHEAMGKVLNGRVNIVITRNSSYTPLHPSVKVYNDIRYSILDCANNNNDEVMIIGGQQIYEQSLELADRIYLTIIDAELDGDAFFPKLGKDWKIIYTRPGKEAKPFTYSFNILEK